jgi:RNA polymerase sigma factor (sigma-70 family)
VDAPSAAELDIENAAHLLALVEDGQLEKGMQNEPLPVPVDAQGKPLRRLTADDEAALATRIQRSGDVDARNALVLANLGLVHLLANQMRRQGIRYDDLVQEGTLGLLRATETFDPTRNVRFSTYCVYWIRAKIQRFLQKGDKEDLPSIAGAEMQTEASGNRRRPRARALSLDAPIDASGESRTLSDVVSDDAEDPEDVTIRLQRERTVDQVLKDIAHELGDSRLHFIIERRILADEPDTLAVLGEELNLSREGARLLETKVLKLARQRLVALASSPG